MAEEIKIRADVDVAEASEKFKALTTRVKELDYAFRQEKISAKELDAGIDALAKKANALTLSYKQSVDLSAQVFQVQQRAANNFTSMSSSLATMDKRMSTANQTLISFSQGMQDSAQFSMGFNQGLRGIANNIQQMSQMFGLLYRETGSLGGAFSMMMKQLASPAGLLIGLAAVTTALQILPSLFKDTASAMKPMNDLLKEQSDLLFKMGKSTRDEREAFLLFQIGREELALGEKTKTVFDYKKSVLARNQDPNSKLIYSTIGTPAEIQELTNNVLKAKNALDDFYKTVDKQDKKVNKGLIKEKDKELQDASDDYVRRANMLKDMYNKDAEDRKETAKNTSKYLEDLEKRRQELEEQGIKYTQQQAEELAQVKENIAKQSERNFREERRRKREMVALWEEENKAGNIMFDSVRSGFQTLISSELMATRQAKNVWDAAWMTMKNSAIMAIEQVIAEFIKMQIVMGIAKVGLAIGTGGASLPFIGVPEVAGSFAKSYGGGKSMEATSFGIASASRRAQNQRQNIQLTGILKGNGRDLVAVVEYQGMNRNTRSMNIAGR